MCHAVRLSMTYDDLSTGTMRAEQDKTVFDQRDEQRDPT